MYVQSQSVSQSIIRPTLVFGEFVAVIRQNDIRGGRGRQKQWDDPMSSFTSECLNIFVT